MESVGFTQKLQIHIENLTRLMIIVILIIHTSSV